MNKFSKFLLTLMLIITGMLLGGIIISKFWSWFLIPIFPTLPYITIMQGIGISMFCSVFFHSDRKYVNTDLIEVLTTNILSQLFTLLLGLLIMFLIL